MKKILEIESSKYSIEYEEGKEWIYSVKRYGVDTGSDLKTNIVFDMFQMILNLQAKNEKLKMTQENSSSRVAITSDGKVLRAFSDDEATSYSIPDGVTTIAQRAFSELENLKSVDIPDSVQFITQNAFEDSGLSSVVLPANIKVIDEYAFFFCQKLSSVGYKGEIYTSISKLEKALKENGVIIGYHSFASTALAL